MYPPNFAIAPFKRPTLGPTSGILEARLQPVLGALIASVELLRTLLKAIAHSRSSNSTGKCLNALGHLPYTLCILLKFNPKQRKQLHRPRPLLFFAVIGTLCLPWLFLLGANGYLRHQQKLIDAEAERFFTQISTHSGNASGQTFDALSAKIGLSPNATYSQPIFINGPNALAFQRIESMLSHFIEQQSNKVTGPLDPLPPLLQQYLVTQQADIDRIQAHLLTSPPPLWNMDIKQLTDASYLAPGFFNVRSVQKLLLLAVIDAHHRGQSAEVIATLDAIWQLNQAIAQRSDLSSQVSVSVISAQQAGLLRHLPNVPVYWQNRLVEQSHHQPVMKGVRFEAWLRYETLKAGWIPTAAPSKTASVSEKMQTGLSNRFSFQTFFKLLSIDSAQTLHRALDQLEELNVCTTSQAGAEAMLSDIQTAFWNSGTALSPEVMGRRWQTAGDRALSLELSQYILQIKQQQEKTGQWPNTVKSKRSQVCPGEQWRYQRNHDNAISISLSKQLLSPTAIPHLYRSASPSGPASPVPVSHRHNP